MGGNIANFTNITSIAVLGLLLLGLTPHSHAATFTQQASLTIEDPIGVESVQTLDFGAIEQPSQTVRVDILPNGDLGQGTTAQMLRPPSAAQLSVRAAGGQSISIQAHHTGNIEFLTLVAMPASFNGVAIADMMQGASGLIAPTGAAALEIGGVIEVAAHAPAGQFTPQFTLDIYYD